MTTKTETKRTEREGALMNLRAILKPGDTVHGVIRSVSATGMSRRIDFYPVADNRLRYLSGYVSTALDLPWNDIGVRVDGCGMNMIAHVVYSLVYALFHDGYDCLGERCPSADHHGYRLSADEPTTHHTDCYALHY